MLKSVIIRAVLKDTESSLFVDVNFSLLERHYRVSSDSFRNVLILQTNGFKSVVLYFPSPKQNIIHFTSQIEVFTELDGTSIKVVDQNKFLLGILFDN